MKITTAFFGLQHLKKGVTKPHLEDSKVDCSFTTGVISETFLKKQSL